MSRPVIVVAVTGTFLLAVGAFVLSYAALRDLAVLAGVPAEQAWLWPLIVDGVILEATISVVALRGGATPARRYAWVLLVAGAAVSVATNITHAVVGADARVPTLVAALVASVPPLVLVAMTHLTVELIRNASPRPARSTEPHPAPALVPALPAASGSAQLTTGRTRTLSAGDNDRQAAPDAGGSGREVRERRRAEAARMAAEKVPLRQIARYFGVHPTTVSRWLDAPEKSTHASELPVGASMKEDDDEHDT
ncbi:MAG: DUF2637 domain-containing protein [Cumulibacter sp.]